MAWNKPKPDDRSDNAEKIQEMINNTMDNLEKAEETMAISDQEEQSDIQDKNERRRQSLEGLKDELADEMNN